MLSPAVKGDLLIFMQNYNNKNLPTLGAGE